MKRGRPGNAAFGLGALAFMAFVATWPFIISRRHVRGVFRRKHPLPTAIAPQRGHRRRLARRMCAGGGGSSAGEGSPVTRVPRPQSSITSSSKEKLPGNLTMRGQYLNTGSNDIGGSARSAALAPPRRSFLTCATPCAPIPVPAGAHPDWDWNTMTLKEEQRGTVHIVTTREEEGGGSGEGSD